MNEVERRRGGQEPEDEDDAQPESETTDVLVVRASEPTPTPPPPELQEDLREEFTPATKRQTIALGSILVGGAVLLLLLWFALFRSTQSQVEREVRAPWQREVGLILTPGPSSFAYDVDARQLIHRGPIDDERKQELVGLLSRGGAVVVPPDPAGASYWEAVDRLALQSKDDAEQYEIYLLLVGGVSGMLGVQVRAISNFIGVTCFKNALDVRRWWPWYALRPALGFLFGLMTVLLAQSGLFQADGGAPGELVWSLAVAFLAGFGASEFSERLRALSQTLFGKG